MAADIIILFYIIGVFIAIAFWEAYIEGSGGWAANQVGWNIKMKVGFLKRPLDAYHFCSWIVMIPAFLMLPFVMFGFNLPLFWFLIFLCCEKKKKKPYITLQKKNQKKKSKNKCRLNPNITKGNIKKAGIITIQ